MTFSELHEAIEAENALSEALQDFSGEWVAVRDHKVVEHARTLNALLTLVEPDLDAIDRILEVGEPGGVCFL